MHFAAEKNRNLRSAEQCPQPNFAPSVPGEKHCTLSHHCSKVNCSLSGDGHKLTLTLKINKCQEPLTATVTLKDPESSLDWSHTFKDGEKAAIPTNTSSFTGGLPVSDASLFIKVGLKRINGSNIHYTVRNHSQFFFQSSVVAAYRAELLEACKIKISANHWLRGIKTYRLS